MTVGPDRGYRRGASRRRARRAPAPAPPPPRPLGAGRGASSSTTAAATGPAAPSLRARVARPPPVRRPRLGAERQLRLGLGLGFGLGLGLGFERDVDVDVSRRLAGRSAASATAGPGVGLPGPPAAGRRRPDPDPRLSPPCPAHERTAPPQRHGRAAAPGSRGAQGAADRGQRDARGDEERDHEDGHEEDGRPAGPQPGLQRAAHDGSQIPAGVAQRARVLQGRVVPQLRQPAHGEQSEDRPDGEAHRFGDLTRPLVFVATVAAPQGAAPRRRPTTTSGRRTRAHPATRASPESTPWPDRTEPRSPEGQGEQDAERDQTDRPQVAGLHAPEGLRGTSGRVGPPPGRTEPTWPSWPGRAPSPGSVRPDASGPLCEFWSPR